MNVKIKLYLQVTFRRISSGGEFLYSNKFSWVKEKIVLIFQFDIRNLTIKTFLFTRLIQGCRLFWALSSSFQKWKQFSRLQRSLILSLFSILFIGGIFSYPSLSEQWTGAESFIKKMLFGFRQISFHSEERGKTKSLIFVAQLFE